MRVRAASAKEKSLGRWSCVVACKTLTELLTELTHSSLNERKLRQYIDLAHRENLRIGKAQGSPHLDKTAVVKSFKRRIVDAIKSLNRNSAFADGNNERPALYQPCIRQLYHRSIGYNAMLVGLTEKLKYGGHCGRQTTICLEEPLRRIIRVDHQITAFINAKNILTC